MARTAITLVELSTYQQLTQLTATAGDAANDHEIDLSKSPLVHVVVQNTGANTISFGVSHPAAKGTYNQTFTYSLSIGANEAMALVLDVPPDLARSGNVTWIGSADANFADLNFYGFILKQTSHQSRLVR